MVLRHGNPSKLINWVVWEHCQTSPRYSWRAAWGTCSICWCQSCNFDLGGKIFPTLPRCSIISCRLYTFFTSFAYKIMYSSDTLRFHMKEHPVTEPKISITLIDVWRAKYLRNILLLITKKRNVKTAKNIFKELP